MHLQKYKIQWELDLQNISPVVTLCNRKLQWVCHSRIMKVILFSYLFSRTLTTHVLAHAKRGAQTQSNKTYTSKLAMIAPQNFHTPQ